MAACKKAEMEQCLLKMRQTLNSEDFLALQTRFSKILPQKEPSQCIQEVESHVARFRRDLYFSVKKLRICCDSWIFFRGKVEISFTLSCVAPRNNALRCRFCTRSTEGMYSPSTLPVADSGLWARALHRLVHFCKTRVIGKNYDQSRVWRWMKVRLRLETRLQTGLGAAANVFCALFNA